jgi:hypothetical protein
VSGEIFLFSYFKGHGDGLHLACSTDGYRWSSIRNDSIFITGEAGIERIMRDPCLILSQDRVFHLVWTCGWNEPGIGYAFSSDLIHWSQQEYLPVMAHEEKARNCWAPEIFFDEVQKHYILYWSSTIEGKFPETQPYGDDGYNHRIYYTTTRDFRHFGETRLLYDGGFNVIDANIVRNGNQYLLFMKNETLLPTQKNLRMAVGDTPYAFGEAGAALTSNHFWAEGPTAIKIKDEWLVYFDKYKINQIGAIRSKDLILWEDVSELIDFPSGAQHGFVLKVPTRFVTELINEQIAEPSEKEWHS